MMLNGNPVAQSNGFLEKLALIQIYSSPGRRFFFDGAKVTSLLSGTSFEDRLKYLKVSVFGDRRKSRDFQREIPFLMSTFKWPFSDFLSKKLTRTSCMYINLGRCFQNPPPPRFVSSQTETPLPETRGSFIVIRQTVLSMSPPIA